MADANGSGTPTEDNEPVQRSPEVQAVVDKWFGDDPDPTEQTQPMQVLNRSARRMNEQRKQGKPTTGRGCLPFTVTAVAAALAGWAVR